MKSTFVNEAADLAEWLFERTPEGWYAQHGYATRDKKAILWVPGRKNCDESKRKWAEEKAALMGMTQLAFRSIYHSYDLHTPCMIAWVGIDIDAKDNPSGPAINTFPHKGWSARRSASGFGVHLIARLSEPIECTVAQAKALIPKIAAPMVAHLKKLSVVVDKADRRMFWLVGGRNEWDFKSNLFMPTPPYRLCGPAVPIPTEDSGAASTLDVTPAIRGILESFRNRGVALNLGSNQVYVGDAVPIIESLGFRVITKSPMSGNGQKNGYLQVTETSVSLWAYADGHTIWEFVDVEALCGK